MSRRLEIELTSARADGSWTWRAAGAREPRGELPASLTPDGAAVGDVLRVEVDTGVDGTTVMAVLPARAARREPDRLEVVGPARAEGPLVTETRVSRSGRARRRDDADDRPGRGRPAAGDRDDRRGRGGRRDAGRGEGRRDAGRGEGRRDAGRAEGRRDTGRRGRGPARDPRPRPEAPERPRPPRLRVGRTHRNEVLSAVPPAYRALTELLLRGGLPAVREAVDRLNAALRADHKAEIPSPAILDLAERLVPTVRLAEWRDRADAALAQADVADLRDLRSVVVAADTIARDDASRAVAAQLRDAVTARVDREQRAWLDEVAAALREGRVVRALRISSRPPKAGALLPPELIDGLRDGATAALAEAAGPDRVVMVLDALAHSPVRLQVAPAFTGTPPEPVVAAIRRLSAQLPQFAAALPDALPSPTA